jgi:A/G-specific adenine glycosylase
LNPDQFASKLLQWSESNQRDLPWKKDKDPYKIWISEIILQQTRVEQGKPYYLRFIKAFPDVQALAKADEHQVLKLWEGLGYYSRARNLHFTARLIMDKYHGDFPKSYLEILNLKGIGPYTAAAIASFAYNLKHAVVDGNVLRLISRLLGILQAIDTSEVKNKIEIFVNKSIKNVDAASFNQGLMDFGATHCTPTNPRCDTCPFQPYCIAHQDEMVTVIPQKSKKIIRKDRHFHVFDIDLPESVTILHQRKETDIWKNLFEFPALESKSSDTPILKDINTFLKTILDCDINLTKKIKPHYMAKQILTHQNIFVYFYKIKIEVMPKKINQDHYLVERTKVSNFAFPKFVTDYLKNTDL